MHRIVPQKVFRKELGIMVSISADIATDIRQNMTRVLNTSGNYGFISTGTRSLGPDIRARKIGNALKHANPEIATTTNSTQEFLTVLYKKLSAEAPKNLNFQQKSKWILGELAKDKEVLKQMETLSDKLGLNKIKLPKSKLRK